jgi:hypothetical protein
MDESDITEVFGSINSGGKHLSNQERRQAGVTTSFAEVVRTIAMQLRGMILGKRFTYLICPRLVLIPNGIIKVMGFKQQTHCGVSKVSLEPLKCVIVKMKI